MQLTGTWPHGRSLSWHRPGAWTVGGLGVLDIAVVVALTGFLMAVDFGVIPPNAPPPTGAAAVGVIVIVSPVIWRR